MGAFLLLMLSHHSHASLWPLCLPHFSVYWHTHETLVHACLFCVCVCPCSVQLSLIRWAFTILWPPFSMSKMFYDIASRASSVVDFQDGTVVPGVGFFWAGTRCTILDTAFVGERERVTAC